MNVLTIFSFGDWMTLAVMILLFAMACGAIGYLVGVMHGEDSGYSRGSADGEFRRKQQILDAKKAGVASILNALDRIGSPVSRAFADYATRPSEAISRK